MTLIQVEMTRIVNKMFYYNMALFCFSFFFCQSSSHCPVFLLRINKVFFGGRTVRDHSLIGIRCKTGNTYTDEEKVDLKLELENCGKNKVF